ncbi:hypothetical protein [Chlorobium phaeobacteroides]|jgi:hypothetical protein|nr:hypothetical protein [Chlorobium phaeobacteroides]
MNERVMVKMFLSLSTLLFIAELVVGLFYQADLRLMVLFFMLAVSLAGILVSLKMLLGEKQEVESVSMRRRRALDDEVMKDVLDGYEVDEEFLGNVSRKGKKRGGSGAVREQNISAGASGAKDESSLEDAIRSHAVMFGGLEKLLDALTEVDELSFGKMMEKAGIQGVARGEVIVQIQTMVDLEQRSCGELLKRTEDSLSEGLSLDKESFDEYIRRCMTTSESESAPVSTTFSLDLDMAAMSKQDGTPPKDFSHAPEAVFSKLKKPGKEV